MIELQGLHVSYTVFLNIGLANIHSAHEDGKKDNKMVESFRVHRK